MAKIKKQKGTKISVDQRINRNLSIDKSEKVTPDIPFLSQRGIGSSYAYAVKNIMGENKKRFDRSNSFLGVEKQILDPKDHTDKPLLHSEKEKK